MAAHIGSKRISLYSSSIVYTVHEHDHNSRLGLLLFYKDHGDINSHSP